MKEKGFFKRNALSLVFLLLMLASMVGQAWTGWKEHNEFLTDHQLDPKSFSSYLSTGHFLQATFENWESEFLQMALFVLLTIYLKQQGSSESRPMDDDSILKEGECVPKPDSPWSVKKGGLFLLFYRNSLTIVLFLLFILSFFLHWYGSWVDFNEKQLIDSKPLSTMADYLGNKRFWFESFQNWQSEFLSILAIVFLSIYLRQAGSSQSKKVNDAHSKTGE